MPRGQATAISLPGMDRPTRCLQHASSVVTSLVLPSAPWQQLLSGLTPPRTAHDNFAFYNFPSKQASKRAVPTCRKLCGIEGFSDLQCLGDFQNAKVKSSSDVGICMPANVLGRASQVVLVVKYLPANAGDIRTQV